MIVIIALHTHTYTHTHMYTHMETGHMDKWTYARTCQYEYQ